MSSSEGNEIINGAQDPVPEVPQVSVPKQAGASYYNTTSQIQVNKGSRLANIEVAEMHGMSRRIYKEVPDSNPDPNNKHQRCPCCNFPVTGTVYSVCCNPEELAELGASFPLIFKFNRFILVALFVISAIATVPCLVDNVAHGSDVYTQQKSFNLITPATFSGQVSIWQPILHVIACGLMVFFYLWILRTIKEKSIEYDTLNTTPADFTLMIKGLPKEYDKKDLKEHVEKSFQFKDLQVVCVVPTYDIGEYMNCTKLLADWKFQHQMVKSYEEQYNEPMKITKCCKTTELEGPDGCRQEIIALESQQQSLSEKMNEQLAPFAFVTLNNQIYTREIAEEWSRSPLQITCNKLCPCAYDTRFRFKDTYIHAEMAPDHTDINWENLALPTTHRYGRRALTIFVGLLTLGVACAIMAATAVWKMDVKNNKDNESGDNIRAATIIPTIVSVMINFAVARIIRVFSTYEKHLTWTHFNRSVLNMLVLFVMLNNIGIPIIIYLVLDQDWFSNGGLAYTVFWLEIMNAFVSPAILLMSPKMIAKNIKRCMYRRQAAKGELRISQREANEAFEGPDVDLADRLANVLKNFTMSLFYAPIVPVGTLIAICGLIFEIAVFKLILLKVCCRPRVYNSDLVKTAADWMKWSLLLYSAGILIFYHKLCDDLLYLEIFFFLAMCGYFLTPLGSVINCCFRDTTLENLRKEFENDQKYNNFFSVLPKFYSDFERENPVTQGTGLKRWRAFIEGGNPESYLKRKIVKGEGKAGEDKQPKGMDHPGYSTAPQYEQNAPRYDQNVPGYGPGAGYDQSVPRYDPGYQYPPSYANPPQNFAYPSLPEIDPYRTAYPPSNYK